MPTTPEDQVPEFKSTLPQTLLDSLPNDRERYLFTTLSAMENKLNWLIEQSSVNTRMSVSAAKRIEDLEQKRIAPLERWKDNITGRWGMVAGVCVLIIPPFAHALWEKMLGVVK